MNRKIILLVLLAGLRLSGFCQGYANYESLTSSSLKDKEGNKHGSGNMQRLSGRCTVPLSRKLNGRKQPMAWNMTFSASCGIMNNEGEARRLNPNRILNASLTVSHLRPLSERWNLIASLGCGIYAVPDKIQWQSLLANGAFIFAYRLRGNLSIGIGGGLTNSYGIPIIMPMGYLNWRTNGRYEVIIDIANAPKIQIATQTRKAVRLELTALEMDGMSAVVQADGRQKIYSSTMICSSLNVSLPLFGKTSIYANVGGIWLRSATMTDRNLRRMCLPHLPIKMQKRPTSSSRNWQKCTVICSRPTTARRYP